MESNPPPPSSKAPSSLYPSVLDSHPDLHSPFLSQPPSSSYSSSSIYPSLSSPPPSAPPADAATTSSYYSMYPSVDMADLVENLFPDAANSDDETKKQHQQPQPPPQAVVEETLVRVPGALLHLIDVQRSVELGAGDFYVVRLRQGQNTVAVLARLGGSGGGGGDGEDLVQWPLARDEAAVKLDDAHYFFSLRVPPDCAALGDDDAEGGGDDLVLNYGLTFAVKGQENVLKELDSVLQTYSSFSVQKVEVKTKDVTMAAAANQVLDASVAKEVTPAEAMGQKKEMMEEQSAAYWTTLAPNVEDYSSSMAKFIAKGSGMLIKGILWCGDVTVDRLKWGEEMLKRKTGPNSQPKEISESAMKRMKRVKKLTKMSNKVANGMLSGVLKVTGFFTRSIVNSKAGKKFFSLLPGEVALASLDGFSKVCDAAELAGKNVLRTSSVVTTSVVSHRYGDQAGEFAQESLHATGHAIGTAYAVFKVRKAFNPKEAIKPTSIAKTAVKAAAAEVKAKKGK